MPNGGDTGSQSPLRLPPSDSSVSTSSEESVEEEPVSPADHPSAAPAPAAAAPPAPPSPAAAPAPGGSARPVSPDRPAERGRRPRRSRREAREASIDRDMDRAARGTSMISEKGDRERCQICWHPVSRHPSSQDQHRKSNETCLAYQTWCKLTPSQKNRPEAWQVCRQRGREKARAYFAKGFRRASPHRPVALRERGPASAPAAPEEPSGRRTERGHGHADRRGKERNPFPDAWEDKPKGKKHRRRQKSPSVARPEGRDRKRGPPSSDSEPRKKGPSRDAGGVPKSITVSWA